MTSAKRKLTMKLILPESFTSEPLFLWLKNVKITSPWVIFLIILAIGVGDLFVGARLGYLSSSATVVGILDVNNIPQLLMSLVVAPGLWAFFVGFPDEVFKVFRTVEAKGILLTEQENIQIQVNQLKKTESSWVLRFAVLPLALSIALYSMQLVGRYKPVPWFYLGWHYWFAFVQIGITAYVTVYSVAWSFLALYTLNRVFSTAKIKVNAYDSDNAGGLLFVGAFIFRVSQLALIVGPFLVAETLFAVNLGAGIWKQANLWVEMIILPVLFSVMIFLPIKACRRAMVFARDGFLRPIMNNILEQTTTVHFPNQPTKAQIDNISSLIDFHTKLRKDFPVWPFDMPVISRLGVSFIASVSPIIVSLLKWFFL